MTPPSTTSVRSRGLSLAGTELAGFHLDQLVSIGPNASVYRGRRGSTEAAVKVYRPTRVPFAVSRMFREVAALERIDHPAIVRLIASGPLADGGGFVVTEWIDGDSLEELMRSGPLPPGSLVTIIRSVARGLVAVHAAGVVHRDVKPANIIVRMGSPPAVICDFGHSQTPDSLEPLERITEPGKVVGSATYMAPEQVVGLPLDGRADLYALGVILHRGLTGDVPFDHQRPSEVMRAHRRDPVKPLVAQDPERCIPAALDDLCLWLLTKDPDKRVPSAHVMLATLSAITPRATREEIDS